MAVPAIALPPKILRHLAKSLKKQWRGYRKELKHCQKDFSEAAVHASRIATRRLLSTVELLAGFLPPPRVKKIRRALKRYLDCFDALRDTHVQLAAVGKLRRTLAGAGLFYRFLRQREERFARQTRRKIRRIQSRPVGKWIKACRQECARQQQVLGPATATALVLRSIDQAFGRTCELRAQMDPQDTKTIHCTRVAFKKFRYMVEELAGFLPGMHPRRLAALHRYQTLMGAIQDAEVLLGVLDQFLATQALEPEPASTLRAQLQQRRQDLIQEYLAAADRLFEFWPAAATAAPPARAATAGLRFPANSTGPGPSSHSHEPVRGRSRTKPKRKAR